MYYHTVEDYYHNRMTDSLDYLTAGEAITAAKEYLVTNNISDGYHIKIFDQPPFEGLEPVQTLFITSGEVNAYATSRISWANRPELQQMIETAHADSRAEKAKYEGGLLTPIEFAKAKSVIWTRAWADIESMG